MLDLIIFKKELNSNKTFKLKNKLIQLKLKQEQKRENLRKVLKSSYSGYRAFYPHFPIKLHRQNVFCI